MGKSIYDQQIDAKMGALSDEYFLHLPEQLLSAVAEKYLELTTKLSLREIRFLIWNITETHIQDNLTKEVFVFRSPMNDVLMSKLAELISEWNLLPH